MCACMFVIRYGMQIINCNSHDLQKIYSLKNCRRALGYYNMISLFASNKLDLNHRVINEVACCVLGKKEKKS